MGTIDEIFYHPVSPAEGLNIGIKLGAEWYGLLQASYELDEDEIPLIVPARAMLETPEGDRHEILVEHVDVVQFANLPTILLLSFANLAQAYALLKEQLGEDFNAGSYLSIIYFSKLAKE